MRIPSLRFCLPIRCHYSVPSTTRAAAAISLGSLVAFNLRESDWLRIRPKAAISAGMWVDDGTCHTQSEGSAVWCTKESTVDSKINALWKGDEGGVTEGRHFWSITVLEGDAVWVGVTSEEKFAPGYRCKGFMYGGPGNTSSGGGLVQGGFGEPVKVRPLAPLAY